MRRSCAAHVMTPTSDLIMLHLALRLLCGLTAPSLWLRQSMPVSRTVIGRFCRGAHTVQTLGISGDPLGDHCNHQEASRKEQHLTRSLWDLLAIIKNLRRHVLCLRLSFSGFLWAVWVDSVPEA